MGWMMLLKRGWGLVFCAVALVFTACGGSGNPSQAPDVAKDASSDVRHHADYGRPQDPKAVARMAQRLGTFFDGKRSLLSPEVQGASLTRSEWEGAPPSKAASATPQAVYRFLNTLTGVHFFTASTEERDWVQANLPVFQYEGPAFFALPLGDEALTPVFRFYNKVSGTHFYTVSSAERDEVIARFSDVFDFEGVSWHASSQTGAGWRPIYRFFNTQTGTHFYTASTTERDNVRNTLTQYLYEGIGYYVRLGSETFTPLVHPESCRVSPGPLLSAALPSQFSATLIQKLDAGSASAVFLNNRGDLAFSTYDTTLQRGVVKLRLASDGDVRIVPSGGQVVGVSPVYELLSLDSEGRLLLNEQPGGMFIIDQGQPLSAQADAQVYANGTISPQVGLKVPAFANHRAGRFTFYEAMGGVRDGSGRQWAWTSAPSFLDAGIVGQTSDTLYLANRPTAVNHCGWGLDMSGRTESGLIWMNGNIQVERWNFQFAYGADDSLRILGTNNRRAAVGYSEGWPVVDMIRGYLKWGPTQERMFENYVPLDVNERLVAVGNRVEVVNGSMPPAIVEKVDGVLFTIDGQPQALKPRVPELNQVGTKISPLKINDNQQVLTEVQLACQQGSTTNALGDACGSKYLYLLSPL